MSYYNQQQRPIRVPPPQGYPPAPCGFTQSNHQQGYPSQRNPENTQPPPQPKQSSGFLEGCLAALCCCCLLDACF